MFTNAAGPSMIMVWPYVDINHCEWCWEYGNLTILKGFGRALCQPCIDRVLLTFEFWGDIAEIRPPWQPDGRARRQAQLELAKFNGAIAKIIAEFERGRWDP